MNYESPYGKAPGLVGRLRCWSARLRNDRSFPWLGTGLISDMEAILQLLDKREFLEALRVSGDPEHGDFIRQLLDDCDTLDALDNALEYAAHAPSTANGDPVRVLESLDEQVEALKRESAAVRDVLVRMGALADDDQATPVVDLLQVLLL